MFLRFLIAAVCCFAIGAGALTVAVACLAGLLEIGCELWLLGPLTMWPLATGLAFLARATRPPTNDNLSQDGTSSDET